MKLFVQEIKTGKNILNKLPGVFLMTAYNVAACKAAYYLIAFVDNTVDTAEFCVMCLPWIHRSPVL